MRWPRHPRLAACALLALLLAGGLGADELKIGYVDFERLAEASPQIAQGRDLLTEEFRPRNEALEAEDAALIALEQRLNRDAAVMSEAARREQERDLRNRRRQLQREQEDLLEEIQFRANEVRAQIERDLEQSVRRFASDNGYDLILVTQILYVSDTVDITDELIALLQAEAASESRQ